MCHPSNRRMTFASMVCCILLAIFAIAAFLPAADRAQQVNNAIRCESNLKQIGQAMTMYANNETRNGLSYPRTYYDLDTVDHPKFFTNWKQPKSFGKGAPEANDVTAAFYLILKTQDLSAAALVCPASGKKQLHFENEPNANANNGGARPIAKSPASISNFPGMDYISYSYDNPYASKDALMTGFKWSATLTSEFAVAADLNPGGKAVATVKPTSSKKEMAAANSPNHGGLGQNVLYGDGHVEFHNSPFCGPALEDKTADNIYTRRAGSKGNAIMGPPMDRNDCILLPAADYKPGK